MSTGRDLAGPDVVTLGEPLVRLSPNARAEQALLDLARGADLVVGGRPRSRPTVEPQEV